MGHQGRRRAQLRARDENGTVHDVVVPPDHFAGGTRCGRSFKWSPGPPEHILEKALDIAPVTCMNCIAAPPDPDFNPWA